MRRVEEQHWWFVGRRAVVATMLRGLHLPVNARVLDAGCGTGRNLAEYRSLGWAVGFDVSHSALSRLTAQLKGAVAVASVEGVPFREGTFDLVCATDVVEHVDDDVGTLAGFRRVTAAGGHLLLTVPAYQALWSDSDVQLHHRRRYTARALSRAVEGAGWRVERTTYFNSILLPAIAAARWTRLVRRGDRARTELERTSPAADRLLRIPLLAEAKAIGAGVRLPCGVSVALLASNSVTPAAGRSDPAHP